MIHGPPPNPCGQRSRTLRLDAQTYAFSEVAGLSLSFKMLPIGSVNRGEGLWPFDGERLIRLRVAALVLNSAALSCFVTMVSADTQEMQYRKLGIFRAETRTDNFADAAPHVLCRWPHSSARMCIVGCNLSLIHYRKCGVVGRRFLRASFPQNWRFGAWNFS